MLLLLYGEDTYRSKEKLSAIRQKFLARHPADNLVEITGSQLTADKLPQLLWAQTLLGGHRLVVITDCLSESDDSTKAALKQAFQTTLPDDLTVIIYESQSFDKRQALFKLLNQPKQAEHCAPLARVALRRQAQLMAQTKNCNITPAVMEILLARTDSDLWRLDRELAKLAAYADGQPVTSQMITTLVPDTLEADIFVLITAGMSRNHAKSQAILSGSLLGGDDPIRMMGALAYQLRNFIRASDLQAAGVAPSAAGSIMTNLSPFTVRTSWQAANKFDRSRLISAYRRLAHTDWQIKTGAWDPEDALQLFALKLGII